MMVFFSNYHIAVNEQMVDDLVASGQTVVVPDDDWGAQHIKFFASNREHFDKAGVIKVTYNQFLYLEPMAIIINCSQAYEDMMQLYRDRGEKDVLVLLSSQLGLGDWIPHDFDYVISHSLDWHRKTKAKYKILYFSRPKQLTTPKTEEEIELAYKNKQINLYINHFDTHLADHSTRTFEKEKADALKLRELWEGFTGYRIPFYGYENADGYLSQDEVQVKMKESMFTLVFKKHETWGQMVNESMLMGTPCIFMKKYTVDMFTEYLITPETSVLANSAESIFKKLSRMTIEEYKTLVMESQSASNMYCNNELNRDKLKWLFDKVAKDNKIV